MTTIKNQAKDKEHYIKSWDEHVKQLSFLGYPLMESSKENELYDELIQIQNRLNQLIKIAADNDFNK